MGVAVHQRSDAAVLERQRQALHGGELRSVPQRWEQRGQQQPCGSPTDVVSAIPAASATGGSPRRDLPLPPWPQPAVSVPAPDQPRCLAAGGPKPVGTLPGPGREQSSCDHHSLHPAGGAWLRPWHPVLVAAAPPSTAGAPPRLAWGAAISLSLLLTLTSNPHRSLSFLVPTSVQPWVHNSPAEQWSHGAAARRALAVIPPQASVAANTPLVPLLARRELLVRFPVNTGYLDRKGQTQSVDWVAVDLELLEHYGRAFAGDWRQLRKASAGLRSIARPTAFNPLRMALWCSRRMARFTRHWNWLWTRPCSNRFQPIRASGAPEPRLGLKGMNVKPIEFHITAKSSHAFDQCTATRWFLTP